MAAKACDGTTASPRTQKHYIKEVPEVTVKAMEKAEGLCTDRTTAVASRAEFSSQKHGAGGGVGILTPTDNT
jgi:hypothetical protein